MAVDIYGLARLNQQKKTQRKSAVDELMNMFESQALKLDTNDEYDRAISNINVLKGEDPLLDLAADVRIKKLNTQKKYNDDIQKVYEKGANVLENARKPYNPNNPTEFEDLMGDLTMSMASVVENSSKTELATMDSIVNQISAVRKASGAANDEKLMADFLETRVQDPDTQALLNVFRKTKVSDYPQMRAVAVAGIGSNSSNTLTEKSYHGLGPTGGSIADSYSNDLLSFNNNLQQTKALARQYGINSPFDVATEGLTSDAKKKQSINYFYNQKKIMGNLVESMVPLHIKNEIEEQYGKKMRLDFENGNLFDSNGNQVKKKSQLENMIGKLSFDNGMFTDKYVDDLILAMERDYEGNLKENLAEVYPDINPKGLTSYSPDREGRFEQIKGQVRMNWKMAQKLYRDARRLDNQVNVLRDPNNATPTDESDENNVYNYKFVLPSQYKNSVSKID